MQRTHWEKVHWLHLWFKWKGHCEERKKIKSSWSFVTQWSKWKWWAKAAFTMNASASQSLRSLWVFLWRQHNQNARSTHLYFPQRVSNPKTKKAELPLIRKLYKFLFSSPLSTEFVSCLSDKTAEIWFLGRPAIFSWPEVLQGGTRCCHGVRVGRGGGLGVSIFDGTVLSKVSSNTACSRFLC